MASEAPPFDAGYLDLDVSPEAYFRRRNDSVRLAPGERAAMGDLSNLWGLRDRSGGDRAILLELIFSFLEHANASRDPVRIMQALSNARVAFCALVRGGYPFQRIANELSVEAIARSFRRVLVKRLLLGTSPEDHFMGLLSEVIDEGAWDDWLEDHAQAETEVMQSLSRPRIMVDR